MVSLIEAMTTMIILSIGLMERFLMGNKLNGFGLIEVMITMIIISIGLLSIGGMYAKTMSFNTEAKQRSEAIIFAQNKIEELRSVACNVMTSGSDTITATASSGSSANYSRRWTITKHTLPTYNDVEIYISWTDNKKRTLNVNLTSKISDVNLSAVTIN